MILSGQISSVTQIKEFPVLNMKGDKLFIALFTVLALTGGQFKLLILIYRIIGPTGEC